MQECMRPITAAHLNPLYQTNPTARKEKVKEREGKNEGGSEKDRLKTPMIPSISGFRK